MPPFSRYQALANRVEKEYPRFNVKYRNKSWLMPIFWLLGKLTGTNYDTFTTTIFSTMYVGATWTAKSDVNKYKLLRHELVHIEQAHNWPLGRWAWPLNHLLWAICYIAVLPILWTFRAKFEREGYTQTMLVEYELYGKFSADKMVRWAKWMERTFAGSTYFFMWRKKATRRWATTTMSKINDQQIVSVSRWVLQTPRDEEVPLPAS